MAFVRSQSGPSTSLLPRVPLIKLLSGLIFFLNVIVRARIVVIYPNKYWSITMRAMLRPLIDKNSTSFLELFDELIFLEGSLVTPDVTFT